MAGIKINLDIVRVLATKRNGTEIVDDFCVVADDTYAEDLYLCVDNLARRLGLPNRQSVVWETYPASMKLTKCIANFNELVGELEAVYA